MDSLRLQTDRIEQCWTSHRFRIVRLIVLAAKVAFLLLLPLSTCLDNVRVKLLSNWILCASPVLEPMHLAIFQLEKSRNLAVYMYKLKVLERRNFEHKKLIDHQWQAPNIPPSEDTTAKNTPYRRLGVHIDYAIFMTHLMYPNSILVFIPKPNIF